MDLNTLTKKQTHHFRIPLSKPYVTDEMLARISSNLSGEWELTAGKWTTYFEDMVKEYVRASYAIAVPSATLGLHAVWRYLNETDPDWCTIAVNIPAYTHPATYYAAQRAGVFVTIKDINPITGQIEVNEHDEDNVCSVSLFGNPFDYNTCHGTHAYVEDAACSLGSTMTGSDSNLPLATVFSFHPRKIITTGEGGMIVTRNQDLHDWIRKFANFGRGVDGLNLKMSNINALFGIEQMKIIEELIERRNLIAGWYKEMLPKDAIYLKHEGRSTYQTFVIKHRRKIAFAIIEHLRKKGIEAQFGSYFIPERAYANVERAKREFPCALELWNTVIALPLFHEMTYSQVFEVVESLKEVW